MQSHSNLIAPKVKSTRSGGHRVNVRELLGSETGRAQIKTVSDVAYKNPPPSNRKK